MPSKRAPTRGKRSQKPARPAKRKAATRRSAARRPRRGRTHVVKGRRGRAERLRRVLADRPKSSEVEFEDLGVSADDTTEADDALSLDALETDLPARRR